MRSGESSALERGLTAPHAGEEIDLALPVGTLARLLELSRRHGDVYRLATRGETADTFVIAHPDHVRQVLTSQHTDFRRSFLDRPMALVLGDGLLTSEADTWKQQRQVLQPCFRGEALAQIFARSSACNRALIDRWRERASRAALVERGALMELADDVNALSIDLNFSALFGVDGPAMLRDIGVDFLTQLTAPLKADTRSNLLFLKEITRVRQRLSTLIAERRRDTARPAADLLGMFLVVRFRNGGAMSDRQILDELLNVLTAGHETIASALKSVWHLLSCHPEIARAVRDEADRVVGDALPRLEQLPLLKYTRQVVQEAMRLCPPLWVIPRKAQRAARIGEWAVPAGSNVFTFLYLTHRHPLFWESPDTFEPQRFAPAAEAARHSHAFIPHGRGPRNCIGSELSMMDMVMHVATAVRELDVTHVDGAPGDHAAGVMLRPRSRVRVVMSVRP